MSEAALGWTALALAAGGTAYQVSNANKTRDAANRATEKLNNDQQGAIDKMNMDQKTFTDQTATASKAAADVAKTNSLRDTQNAQRPNSGAMGAAGRAGTILTGPLGIPGGDYQSNKRRSIIGG